jgi:hypothetical protein
MRKAVEEVVNAWTELRARVAEREAGPASTANAPAVTKQPEPPATKNVVSPAAEPAEQPADVIEPDCDGELVSCSSVVIEAKPEPEPDDCYGELVDVKPSTNS